MDIDCPADIVAYLCVDFTSVPFVKISVTSSILPKDLPKPTSFVLPNVNVSPKTLEMTLAKRNPHTVHPLMKHTLEHLIEEFLSIGNVTTAI